MKKIALLFVVFALIVGCTGEYDPDQPLVGRWQPTHYGTIVDGEIEMTPALMTENYTFKRNGKGRFHSEFYEQSFEWHLSDNRLLFTNWKLEKGEYPAIEPGSHYPDSDNWTVRKLTFDELIVSYRMIPAPQTVEPAYEAVRAFKKIK